MYYWSVLYRWWPQAICLINKGLRWCRRRVETEDVCETSCKFLLFFAIRLLAVTFTFSTLKILLGFNLCNCKLWIVRINLLIVDIHDRSMYLFHPFKSLKVYFLSHCRNDGKKKYFFCENPVTIPISPKKI